jgi:hypothetical protein
VKPILFAVKQRMGRRRRRKKNYDFFFFSLSLSLSHTHSEMLQMILLPFGSAKDMTQPGVLAYVPSINMIIILDTVHCLDFSQNIIFQKLDQ